MLIFTGARRGNMTAMRWEEFDSDRALWRIPQTKHGSPVTIPLAPEAMQILAVRRQHVPVECPWVFPSYGTTGHVVEIKTAWVRILKRAGIAGLRIHDLRRTLGSWQAAAGSSLLIIGKSLGHKTAQATAIYARLDLDPVRMSVEIATRAMMTAANLLPPVETERHSDETN